VARRTNNSPSASIPRLTVSRAELDRRLEERIDHGQGLLDRPIASDEDLKTARDDYYTWHDYNTVLIQRSFSTSEPANEYKDWIGFGSGSTSLPAQIKEFHEDVGRYLRRLVSLKERLELYEEIAGAPRQEAQTPSGGTAVFVVHGRSDATKQAVARFIEQVSSLKPLVLHEQPSSGRTIIEKFENYAASASFAIVLLTGDDEGGCWGPVNDTAEPGRTLCLSWGSSSANLVEPVSQFCTRKRSSFRPT
jgi:CAP12/Pycsar effector protein, TIR domain